MKEMEDSLELEVFEIKDSNGGIEMPEVPDLGEDDDDDEMGGACAGGRKRRKKKRRKCKRSPSVTAAVTLAEPECDDVDGDHMHDPDVPGDGCGSRGISEGTPGSRRPTGLRESLLSVLGKLVIWRRGGARYRNNSNGGSSQNVDYLRGFVSTGELKSHLNVKCPVRRFGGILISDCFDRVEFSFLKLRVSSRVVSQSYWPATMQVNMKCVWNISLSTWQ
jgi:hypothetical protein